MIRNKQNRQIEGTKERRKESYKERKEKLNGRLKERMKKNIWIDKKEKKVYKGGQKENKRIQGDRKKTNEYIYLER